MQLGNSFWSEEFLGLTDDELIFIKPSSRLGIAKRLRLPLASIISVYAANSTDFPFMLIGVFCFIVTTFSKQYTILVRQQDVMEMWVDTIDLCIHTRQLQQNHAGAARTNAGIGNESMAVESGTNNPTSTNGATRHLDLLIRPKGWKLGDRLVLNSRSFTAVRCRIASVCIYEQMNQTHVVFFVSEIKNVPVPVNEPFRALSSQPFAARRGTAKGCTQAGSNQLRFIRSFFV